MTVPIPFQYSDVADKNFLHTYGASSTLDTADASIIMWVVIGLLTAFLVKTIFQTPADEQDKKAPEEDRKGKRLVSSINYAGTRWSIWAEKKAIKTSLARWKTWVLLEPQSPDAIRTFLAVEKELAQSLVSNNKLFREALFEADMGAMNKDEIYREIRRQAEVTYGEETVKGC